MSEAHIIALRVKHADLQTQIDAAQRRPSLCSLELKRLKKSKMAIKAEIRSAETRLAKHLSSKIPAQ